jgi:hypothetical protein
MKELLWKELQEHGKWLPLPGLVILLVFVLDRPDVPMFDTTAGYFFCLIAVAFGAALGFVQVYFEGHGDKRSMLLHRPLSATRTLAYDPAGSPWKVTGTAGLASNGSALNNPQAPQGRQVAFLQQSGSSISQWSISPPAPTSSASWPPSGQGTSRPSRCSTARLSRSSERRGVGESAASQ